MTKAGWKQPLSPSYDYVRSQQEAKQTTYKPPKAHKTRHQALHGQKELKSECQWRSGSLMVLIEAYFEVSFPDGTSCQVTMSQL